MADDPEAVPLLHDALNRVVANPTASHLWHSLLAHFEATTDADAQRSVCQKLIAHTPAQGIAGFLRATFLAWVTGRIEHVADAGREVQAIEPIDPERLMAFATFEWGRALTKVGDRDQFLTHLRGARLHEIVHLAGTHLSRNAPCSLSMRAIDRVGKVALVASFIGLANHPPTVLAMQQSKIMQELGMQVQVFSCQEFLMPDMSHYLGNMGRITTPAPDSDPLIRLIPPGVSVTVGDHRFSLMRRWQEMLGAIVVFDPDLVLFVGLYSPLVTPLYETRPVLGLCVHSVMPMAPVDVWLTASQSLAGRHSALWHPPLPPALGHYHPYRISLKPIGAPIARADLGVTEADLVLVTVGARLEAEIVGDWAARMTGLLARDHRLVWLLVGGAGILPLALADIAPSQLKLFAYRDDLRSFLRCCDICINPPRLGGGFSVAEAMAEGVPVVAMANSDGGNKLGAFAVDTVDAYFDRLRALIEVPALRETTGTAMRAVFADTLDLNRSGPSLLDACMRTVEHFSNRTGSRDS